MNYVEKVIEALSEELPGLDRDLLRLYALLAMTTGTETSLEDVHDAWSLWKNEIKADHKSLIPFSELTVEVQELDRKYADAIRKVALDYSRNVW